MQIQIVLNGEPLSLAEGSSVAELLQQLELHGRRIAVELNRDIVVRSAHATTLLRDGDRIEIVHAIGGG